MHRAMPHVLIPINIVVGLHLLKTAMRRMALSRLPTNSFTGCCTATAKRARIKLSLELEVELCHRSRGGFYELVDEGF